jgi:hypothetical protein
VWGVAKWAEKNSEGVGSKAIENQALIEKYNQKLGFALD